MAINIPIITEFVDAGLKSAQGAFDNFRTKVGEAEGSLGKLKAGSGAAFDAIKANAGAMALGAGTAIAGFAIKAIGDFQALALEVDKFSNSTGLAAEEASRWIEVAGDIGVESGTLLTSMNKLNQAVGKNSEVFQELGIEIVKTSTGATDVNETFLNTIDALRRIDDPATRARVATQLLGKSWTEVSELVEMGSGQLKQALEEVSDAKVIDEAEIEKAKQFRDNLDELKGRGEDFALMVGETLIPILSDLLEVVDFVAGAFSKAGEILGSVTDFMSGDGLEKMVDHIKATENVNDVWADGYRAMIDAYDATQELTTGLEDVDDALAILKGNVDERQAWRNLRDDIDKVKDAAIRAFTEGTPEALRNSEAALDNARLKVGEYITSIDGIPEDQKTEFIANLDRANIDEIEAMLAYIARARQIPFMPVLAPGAGGIGEIGSGGRPIGEAPISLGRGNRMAVGGVTVNVAGSVVTERDLVNSVRKGLIDSQRNGAPLVYSNS